MCEGKDGLPSSRTHVRSARRRQENLNWFPYFFLLKFNWKKTFRPLHTRFEGDTMATRVHRARRSCLPEPDSRVLCRESGHLKELRGSKLSEHDPLESITRLCNGVFSNLEGEHLKVLSNLAHPSEKFFVSNAANQLLRTKIESEAVPEILFSPTLKEVERCKLMSVHSNVLPCDSYGTKIEGSTRDEGSEKAYFPCSILDDAFREKKTLQTKLDEWRKLGEPCNIGQHGLLKSGAPDNSEKLFWNIRPADAVSESVISKEGGDADIWQVKWRGGTFAKKDRRGVCISEAEDRELKILKMLSHPHIVYGFGEYARNGGPRASLFMEYIQSTLFRIAVQNGRDREVKRFSRGDSLDILFQIADAMAHMHEHKLIHGDLKSQNILVICEISGGVRHYLAKVADFGDAQFISDDKDSFTPSGFGTNTHAAPELLKSTRFSSTDGYLPFTNPSKIDVYSFGCVAYEVLTGQFVYEGRALSNPEVKKVVSGELNPSKCDAWKALTKEFRYPLDCIQLIERCWELSPEDRPAFVEIRDKLKELKSNVIYSMDKGGLNFCESMATFRYKWSAFISYASTVVQAFRL